MMLNRFLPLRSALVATDQAVLCTPSAQTCTTAPNPPQGCASYNISDTMYPHNRKYTAKRYCACFALKMLSSECERRIRNAAAAAARGRHAAFTPAFAAVSMPELPLDVSRVGNEAPGQLRQTQDEMLAPGLYLVCTPIGNLEDITFRAVRVLRQARIILAEDTRRSRHLLNHYAIQVPLLSCHEHNEHSRSTQVLEWLQSGAAVALISDAGMPGISDPGGLLIAAALEAGHRVIPIPGPSAVLAALVASGLPAAEFHYMGFLPPKPAARQKRLTSLAGLAGTLVIFVSPHAVAAVLQDAAKVLGSERNCCVAREITKYHEEFYRATLRDAAAEFASRSVKGELTLVVEGAVASAPPSLAVLQQHLQELLFEQGASPSEAIKTVAKAQGVGRSQVYRLALELLKEHDVKHADTVT